MDKDAVYLLNDALFDSGISASVDKNPYGMSFDELGQLETELGRISGDFGEEVVFVEWGQPCGGPVTGHKYHTKADINKLLRGYEAHQLKGIHPRAGFVIDLGWISKRRNYVQNNSTQGTEFNTQGYFEFLQSNQF